MTALYLHALGPHTADGLALLALAAVCALSILMDRE
jgi:hypothetical protein